MCIDNPTLPCCLDKQCKSWLTNACTIHDFSTNTAGQTINLVKCLHKCLICPRFPSNNASRRYNWRDACLQMSLFSSFTHLHQIPEILCMSKYPAARFFFWITRKARCMGVGEVWVHICWKCYSWWKTTKCLFVSVTQHLNHYWNFGSKENTDDDNHAKLDPIRLNVTLTSVYDRGFLQATDIVLINFTVTLSWI